ncbi:hypothetical protein, partial [Denitromonas sp.]|uniref:hypothetical protein n=1 Tax=Denitromonas sp. TaxID=2734609 RepID=UPI002FDE2768
SSPTPATKFVQKPNHFTVVGFFVFIFVLSVLSSCSKFAALGAISCIYPRGAGVWQASTSAARINIRPSFAAKASHPSPYVRD